MPQSDTEAWSRLAVDTWSLSFEAASVMWLRGLRMMTGGKLAEREAERMVREKVMANMMLWPALMLGGVAQGPEEIARRTLQHYGPSVRANRRRLTR
ncbi:hypothetical protein AAW00_11385 [Aurantiacibacter luteus]|uniref:Uncharacterized protein n=2 Tax=Aurantiacibacter luteus TaxID=1581420 RepID=A0A0G9MW43_9SPHN|nr:hypothetical protein AAW00_11385 [Aurantiacibacter luteus]